MPWAVVSEVGEGSPAEAAGLQTGDRLVVFGSVVGEVHLMARLRVLFGLDTFVAPLCQVSFLGQPRPRTEQGEWMRSLATVLQNSVGTAVPIVVERSAEDGATEAPSRIQLNLRPQSWSGRGVLGCKVEPI